MTDQTEKPKLGTRPPLGLKRTVETGKVKQSFSHGRSNTVVVEVKKRRILGKPGEPPPAEAPKPAPVAEAPKPAPKPAVPAPKRAPADDISSRRELQEKLLREADESRMASLEEARRRDDRVKVEQTEDEKRRAEDNRRSEEAADEQASQVAEQPAVDAAPEPTPVVDDRAPQLDDEEERGHRRPGGAPATKRPEPPRPSRSHEDRRHSGKLTVTRALSGEDEDRKSVV